MEFTIAADSIVSLWVWKCQSSSFQKDFLNEENCENINRSLNLLRNGFFNVWKKFATASIVKVVKEE